MQKEEHKQTLFIIDGSSFLYRAYYAIKPLHTLDGKPVNAVFGFCRMIKKLLDTFKPTHLVIVFDSPGKTVRHEIYGSYKEKRQAPPSDLIDQKDLIIEFAEIIKAPLIMKPGIEADDIMYSLALKAEKEGYRSVIVSSDKDMRQLVNENRVVFDPFQDSFLDTQVLEAKYGFSMSKLPFYFALLGDASDNIPGVRGIGEKKATEIVKQFKNLDDMYDRIDELPISVQKNLIAYKDDAYISYELFLLRLCDIDMEISHMVFGLSDWQSARPFFEMLNFKTLIKELPVVEEVFEPLSKKHGWQFNLVTTEKQLNSVVELIKQKKYVALDTETNGLRPFENKLIGISLCVEAGTSYYVPFGHTQGDQLSQEMVIKSLKPVLEDASIGKALHSAKFDWLFLYDAGILVQGIVFDTYVAAGLVVLDGQKLGLKSLSEQFLGDKMLSFEAVCKMSQCKTFAEVPLELATEYAAADAHQTFLLAEVLKKDLERLPKVYSLYHDIENPIISILCAMEAHGIYLDTGILAEIDKHVSQTIKEIKATIIEMVGPEYKDLNLNSPKQLEELLFKHLGLTPLRKTTAKTGYSTDQKVLEELAEQHPIPRLIVKYRELFKLKSTYIDALPGYINKKTGRIHTTFNQTQVATGRLSSSEPNLQNVPVESGKHLTIRAAFKPNEGYSFVAADYSQIELRVLAYLSQDEALLEAFLQGKDIHAQTASRLFDVSVEHVTHDQRQIGKRINFSVLYGLTPFGLSKELGIPYKEAQHYIEKYFEQYPGVAAWMEDVIVAAKDHGFVQTHWGRMRYVPGIYERNRNAYDGACRIAINTVAQGTAAEIMKQGMIRLDRALRLHAIDAAIVLQIHDELIVSVKDQYVKDVLPLIKESLESIVDWNVPLEITLRTGKSWQEVTK